MRLSFFDPPRPGELLYSALARYGRWKGLASPKAVMSDLFGRPSNVATLDLPNSLGELFARATAVGRRADDVIGRHTLFGYYTAFQPPARVEAARRAMMGSRGGLHLLLGVATFRTGRPSHLQFCPACLDGMGAAFGSLHWRADHQLPGVLVCPDHGCRLRKSAVELLSVNRHAYVEASREVCPSGSEPVTGPLAGRTHELAHRVARASAALLSPDHPGRSRAELRDGYRARLADAGFVRGRHKVDQVGLKEAFVGHFGELLERFSGVELDCAAETWLNSIVRSSTGAHPPLQHVLLDVFLGDAAELGLRLRQPVASDGADSSYGSEVAGSGWRAIDLRYASLIRRRAAELRRETPPARVTAAAIERGVGRRDWLSKRRLKLPRSTMAMSEQVETTEAFRLRRLRWHIQRCLAEGECDPWVIHRRAGLPHGYITTVRSELSTALARRSLSQAA